MNPSNVVVFLKGDLLQMSSDLEAIRDFDFTKFDGLSHVGDLFYCDQVILISPKSCG